MNQTSISALGCLSASIIVGVGVTRGCQSLLRNSDENHHNNDLYILPMYSIFIGLTSGICTAHYLSYLYTQL